MIKKEVSVPRVILGFAIVLAMAGSGASSAMQAQPAVVVISAAAAAMIIAAGRCTWAR